MDRCCIPMTRVSGAAGTCRCRPRHACRQGQGFKGGARARSQPYPNDTATRDQLVREAADRLDVPVDYVLAPGPRDRGPTRRAAQACPPSCRFDGAGVPDRCLSSARPRRHDFRAARGRSVLLGAHPPRPCPLRRATSSDSDGPRADWTTRGSRRSSPSSPSRHRSGAAARPSARSNSVSCSSSAAGSSERSGARLSDVSADVSGAPPAEQSVRTEMGSISIGQTA